MTPQQLIEFLQKSLETQLLNPDKEVVYGYSYNRCSPLEADDFEILYGQLFLNTYEGM